MSTFEWQRAAILLWVDHLQRLLFGLDGQGHTLARELAGDGVGIQIDFHKSLAIDPSHQMLSFHPASPGIGIDQVGNGGQRRQGGKGDPGRLIATTDPLMRSLPIRVGCKSPCHLANLIQGLRALSPQALLSERAVIAFDKAMRVGGDVGRR